MRKIKYIIGILVVIYIIIVGTITYFISEPIKEKKEYYENLSNTTICDKETFTEQLEYILNEQAVFYNLDKNNIYEDKIDTSENKFEEYMKEKGWEVEVYLVEDIDGVTLVSKYTNGNILIEIASLKGGKSNKYFIFSDTTISYWDANTNDMILEGFTYNADFDERKELNDIANNIENFKIKLTKDDLKFYNITEEEGEKYSKLGEKKFKKFVLDIQGYIQEEC